MNGSSVASSGSFDDGNAALKMRTKWLRGMLTLVPTTALAPAALVYHVRMYEARTWFLVLFWLWLETLPSPPPPPAAATAPAPPTLTGWFAPPPVFGATPGSRGGRVWLVVSSVRSS